MILMNASPAERASKRAKQQQLESLDHLDQTIQKLLRQEDMTNQSRPAHPATQSNEAYLKAKWNASAALRAEFCDDFEIFKAYYTEQPGIKIRFVGDFAKGR